ncbi:MAG: T9SS type A sorting domain-containing protein [Bacteroidetes bacterium]|nr:T9SS type A sorting domain-containing protein [Bacteroidota bacterium]
MRAILLLAALLMAVSPVLAQTWDEAADGGGDAGDLPGSAQVLSPGTTYTTITGNMSVTTDVDMYQIYISDPAGFSASTCNNATAKHGDTNLHLFAADGSGVYMNDDEPDPGCAIGGFLSLLPAGDPNSPTTADIYYLAIGAWPEASFDAGGGRIFEDCGFTSICAPLDSDPIASWDGGALGNFGDYQIDLTGGVTPVELVSFNATVNGTAVTLNWATSSETNNAGFEVQMQNGEGWDVLGFVEGHGTTTEAQTYAYTAGDIGVGTHTFRLKQLDFDGVFEYSYEVEATVETPGSHLISSAYPNPFNPQSQFTLAVAQEQRVTAEMFNTLGQRVAVLFEGTVEANQPQLVTIDGAGLASGMYVVRVTGERFADALSVTLLK